MKFYSYFDGKTQFHKYFWALYFLLGRGGGGGSGGQITASFACDIDQEERVVALLILRFCCGVVVYVWYLFHAVPWVSLRSVIEMMECIRRLRYVLLYPALLQNRNFLVRVALIPQHLDWLQSLIQFSSMCHIYL